MASRATIVGLINSFKLRSRNVAITGNTRRFCLAASSATAPSALYDKAENIVSPSNEKPSLDTNVQHVVHAAVSTQAREDIAVYMRENDIKISGENIDDLKPKRSFREFNFPDKVQAALKSKFEQPTVIQSASWPIALAGRDLVGIAQTGSGKTLAFLLPALVHICEKESSGRPSGPRALVLCPTRELAQQVQRVADEWSRLLTRVRTVCVFGGASRLSQERQLRAVPEICVATPGRLNDFLNSASTNLRSCTYLVLDEADRMLDMGFEPQIREILRQMNTERQTLMYSATWPKDVRELASDFLNDYVYVKIGSSELMANKNITQFVHVVEANDKDDKFWSLLSEEDSHGRDKKVLVFCLQKSTASYLERIAQKRGFRAGSIHGDKSQAGRDKILNDFRHNYVSILFATDVAARGLDIDNIDCVINYDHPMCTEDYVHRIGRTARKELKGVSHTFLTPDDCGNRAAELVKVLQESGQEVPSELVELAQQPDAKQMKRRWGKTGGFAGMGRNMYSQRQPRQRDWDYDSYRRPAFGNRSSSYNQGRSHNRRPYQRNDDGDDDEIIETGSFKRPY